MFLELAMYMKLKALAKTAWQSFREFSRACGYTQKYMFFTDIVQYT